MPDIHFECPKCNQSLDAPQELASQLIDCPTCKETIEVPIRSRPAKEQVSAPPQPPPPSRPPTVSSSVPPKIPAPFVHMATETTFFKSGDITVTNARFIVGAQTFAMRGVTSVQAIKIPGSYGASVAMISIGGIIALIAVGSSQFVFAGLGVPFLALGILMATREKPIFAVMLRTAGGEVTAYRSYDWSYISQIIEALNQSIISHG